METHDHESLVAQTSMTSAPAETRPGFSRAVIHYHEIGLKGENRRFFERQLARNVLRAASHLGVTKVERGSGRLLATLAIDADWQAVSAALTKVFGIAYFAPVVQVSQDLNELKETAVRLLSNETFTTFKIETKRAQKSYYLNSMEVNREVGSHVGAHFGAGVDLSMPDRTVWIEIVDNYSLMYSQRVPGPGGLPVGTGERAVCLLSGGIDSPVAAYRILKRGVVLIYVHFHSVPFTSMASQALVEKLVALLTQYQYRALLYLIPFAEIQQHIVANSPPSLRVILYRRAMVRMAEMIAAKNKAQALVTGDSIGQVASQTLANMRVISDAASLPIIRPLAGDDKLEIISQARRIGTFEISIEPFEDCCSLFVPPRPETRARLERVRHFDELIAAGPLCQSAIESAVVKRFTHRDSA